MSSSPPSTSASADQPARLQLDSPNPTYVCARSHQPSPVSAELERRSAQYQSAGLTPSYVCAPSRRPSSASADNDRQPARSQSAAPTPPCSRRTVQHHLSPVAVDNDRQLALFQSAAPTPQYNRAVQQQHHLSPVAVDNDRQLALFQSAAPTPQYNRAVLYHLSPVAVDNDRQPAQSQSAAPTPMYMYVLPHYLYPVPADLERLPAQSQSAGPAMYYKFAAHWPQLPPPVSADLNRLPAQSQSAGPSVPYECASSRSSSPVSADLNRLPVQSKNVGSSVSHECALPQHPSPVSADHDRRPTQSLSAGPSVSHKYALPQQPSPVSADVKHQPVQSKNVGSSVSHECALPQHPSPVSADHDRRPTQSLSAGPSVSHKYALPQQPSPVSADVKHQPVQSKNVGSSVSHECALPQHPSPVSADHDRRPTQSLSAGPSVSRKYALPHQPSPVSADVKHQPVQSKNVGSSVSHECALPQHPSPVSADHDRRPTQSLSAGPSVSHKYALPHQPSPVSADVKHQPVQSKNVGSSVSHKCALPQNPSPVSVDLEHRPVQSKNVGSSVSHECATSHSPSPVSADVKHRPVQSKNVGSSVSHECALPQHPSPVSADLGHRPAQSQSASPSVSHECAHSPQQQSPVCADPKHRTPFNNVGPSLSYVCAPKHCAFHRMYLESLADAYAGFAERLRNNCGTPAGLFQHVRDAMFRAGLVPTLYDREDDGVHQPESESESYSDDCPTDADSECTEGSEHVPCPGCAAELSSTTWVAGEQSSTRGVAFEDDRVLLVSEPIDGERLQLGPADIILPVAYLVGGKNETIPAISKRLELRRSAAGKPQGVYATSDISPGEVVAIDEPYVCGPTAYYQSICHYEGCLKMTKEVIICPECLLAQYCDEVCMENAIEDGHDVECRVLYYMQSVPGNLHLNRLALHWFIKECSKVDVQSFCSFLSRLYETTTMHGFGENGLFKSDNFMAAYSMDTKGTSFEDLFFFNCVAVEILEYLMLSGFKIPKCHRATAGASIAHMLDVLDSNCRKLSVHNPSIYLTSIQDKPYPIAYALYPSIGLFNHSCDANVKRSGLLSDKTIVLKAIRPIPKGNQLFVSYGVDFNTDTIDTRLFYCMDNFKFKCTCQPCVENWPLDPLIPDQISLSNLINPLMEGAVLMECERFIEFRNSKDSNEFHHHLNYLYHFNKFMFANIKRPFKLYEECLSMISIAHNFPSIYDINTFDC